MTLDEQIQFLQERAARSVRLANHVADVPVLQQLALEDAAGFATVANTLIAERQRRADHRADWS